MDYMARCYQKDPCVISKVVGNEMVLVPIRDNTANLEEIFMLNETSGHIWGCIDGKNSVEAIKKIIIKEFDVAAQDAQTDMISFFKQLEKEGCIRIVDSKKKLHKTTKGSLRNA